MTQLHEKVRSYYLSNLKHLPQDKQFHFVSRLASWSQDEEALKQLPGLLPTLLPDATKAKEMLAELIRNPPEAKINAVATRRQYFDTYPRLRPVSFALFRVRHLLTLYDIDIRDTLLDVIPYDELAALGRKVHDDPDAMRVLSTYAINYLYLTEHILYRRQPQLINLDYFYSLADGYDLDKHEDLQLCIYLYTHCIIGETNYYVDALGDIARPTATRMLRRLETLIDASYQKINLDNKLEFLVCCQIASYSTPLAERIAAECKASVSDEGMFLVDRHNHNAQSDKKSLVDSEHRNVLFIMSQTPYRHA